MMFGKKREEIKLIITFFIVLLVIFQLNNASYKNTTNIEVSNFWNNKDKLIPPKGIYSYGGSPIFHSLTINGINGSIEAKYPNFKLRYAKPITQDFGDDTAITMLLDGELTFAYVVKQLTDIQIQQAQIRNVSLKQIPIAVDNIVFFGNKNSGYRLNYFTKNQIADIYSRNITNWRNLNSSSKNSTIYPIYIANEELSEFSLNKEIINSNNIKEVKSYDECIKLVSFNKNALSFGSFSLIKNKSNLKIFGYNKPFDKILNNYPLKRKIYIIYRDDGSEDSLAAQAYINYIYSDEGKFILEKAGLETLSLFSN